MTISFGVTIRKKVAKYQLIDLFGMKHHVELRNHILVLVFSWMSCATKNHLIYTISL
jgi:hypothetical protein